MDDIRYGTFLGDALNSDDITKLNKGDLALCAIGSVRWKDATGRYDTYFHRCVVHEQNGTFNWKR